jgi:Tat protein translocase TatB subunit
MLNLGTGELLVIFLVALIVLGPNKLPDAARQMGRMVAELRRLSTGFQDEMRAAMQEPTPTLPPLPPHAERQTPPVAEKPVEPAQPTRRRGQPLRADGAVPAEQQLGE